jgi:hypothetical protein
MILIIKESILVKSTPAVEKCVKDFVVYNVNIGDMVRILPQKVCLNEVDMNTLFSEVFVHTDYSIGYAWIGGEGCNFSLFIEPTIKP